MKCERQLPKREATGTAVSRIAPARLYTSVFSMARVPYSHELYALARHIVFRCEGEHKAAVECKGKHDWPEDCKPESEALVRATNKL